MAGSHVAAAALSPWLLTALAVVLAAVILLFLFFGHYTRRETVIGQLVSSAGVLNIAASSAGMLLDRMRRGHTCSGVMSCFASSPV